MADPTQGCLQQCEAMLCSNRLNNTQGFKGSISEITLPVVGSGGACIAVPAFRGNILRLVFAREKSTGKGIVNNNIKAIPVAGRNKFSLNIACFKW